MSRLLFFALVVKLLLRTSLLLWADVCFFRLSHGGFELNQLTDGGAEGRREEAQRRGDNGREAPGER